MIAHLIGAAANSGKIALYGGNPLAFNYPQWLRFIKASFDFMGCRDFNASAVLAKHTGRNTRMLYAGWEDSVFLEPGFPILTSDQSHSPSGTEAPSLRA